MKSNFLGVSSMLLFIFETIRVVPLLIMINIMYGTVSHISFKMRWKVVFF